MVIKYNLGHLFAQDLSLRKLMVIVMVDGKVGDRGKI